MGCCNSNNNDQKVYDSQEQVKLMKHDGAHLESDAFIVKSVRFQEQDVKRLQNKKQTLHKMRTLNEEYTDPDFQPEYSSLTYEQNSRMKSYVWRRATEFIDPDKLCIFNDVKPQDIVQGALGDCYFLSALSVLAEKPLQIQKLFETKNTIQQGCYAVWLCVNGAWQMIIIDDFFPCINEKSGPAFSRGKGNEIWVLLLEKAYAKVYGSYHTIELGFTSHALRDLTGAPYQFIDNEKGPDEVWNFLRKNQSQNFLMTVSSQSSTKGIEQDNGMGVVSSHAYGILDVREVNCEKVKAKLIQIRNPWGQGEWKGDWSDHSTLWTPELKKQLGWQDADDGIFWINIQDYCKEFSETRVSLQHDNYNYSFYKIDMLQNHQVAINFKVHKDNCYGYISVSQKSQRFFHQNLILYYGTTNKVQYLCGEVYGQERDNFIKVHFKTKGVYTAIVDVDWLQNHSNNVVISAYSEDHVSFATTHTELNDIQFKQIMDNIARAIQKEFNPKEEFYDDKRELSKFMSLGGYRYSCKYNFNIEKSFSDSDLIKRCKKEGECGERVKDVLHYSLWIDDGLFLYFENLSKYSYTEEIKIQATNLTGIDHDISKAIQFTIKSGKNFHIRLKKINMGDACEYSSNYQYYIE